ncbi:hypothetical protein C8Q73DRAFT_189032 [Cubamyces lactineus]|nr:hypothetical protein C8Q73DRAFT_189032 [Cubamyces lactineus]
MTRLPCREDVRSPAGCHAYAISVQVIWYMRHVNRSLRQPPKSAEQCSHRDKPLLCCGVDLRKRVLMSRHRSLARSFSRSFVLLTAYSGPEIYCLPKGAPFSITPRISAQTGFVTERSIVDDRVLHRSHSKLSQAPVFAGQVPPSAVKPLQTRWSQSSRQHCYAGNLGRVDTCVVSGWSLDNPSHSGPSVPTRLEVRAIWVSVPVLGPWPVSPQTPGTVPDRQSDLT